MWLSLYGAVLILCYAYLKFPFFVVNNEHVLLLKLESHNKYF